MGIASVDQTLATQQEWVRPELEDLALSASILWKRFSKNTQVKPVSNRPARIPTMPSKGGKPRVGNLDGGDLGLGSGPTTVPGQLTTTTFVMAWSYTKEAEYATDSDEKAIEDFRTLTRSIAPKSFADFMDTTLQGNGSNTLDSIVSTVVSGASIVGFVVNNANFFLDDQDVDVWSALGTAGPVASVTVESSDILNNTIWLLNPIPVSSGVTTGYLLLVSGSAGQANTGMFGLRYYQVGTNTGNWMGVQRSAWPGKYVTPTIPVNGALTPQVVRAIFSLIELSKGEEALDGEGIFGHCNVDVRDAWEQNALLVQRIDYNAVKGDTSEDMLKRKAATTIAGREMLVNPRALPGYLDILKEKNCFRVETKPVDFYDVAGQTLFPLYGQSGGIATSLVFYMIWQGQLGITQTRENAFLSGITIPKGLFGF